MFYKFTAKFPLLFRYLQTYRLGLGPERLGLGPERLGLGPERLGLGPESLVDRLG